MFSASGYHGYGPQLDPASPLGTAILIVALAACVAAWWYGTTTREQHDEWLESYEARIDAAIAAEIRAGHDVEFIQEQYRRERRSRHEPGPYAYTAQLLRARDRSV